MLIKQVLLMSGVLLYRMPWNCDFRICAVLLLQESFIIVFPLILLKLLKFCTVTNSVWSFTHSRYLNSDWVTFFSLNNFQVMHFNWSYCPKQEILQIKRWWKVRQQQHRSSMFRVRHTTLYGAVGNVFLQLLQKVCVLILYYIKSFAQLGGNDGSCVF